jgi:putative membrane protein
LFFYVNNNYSRSFIFLCLQLFLFGFIVEVIGVNTGIIFGEYTYGKTLGLTLFSAPLIMGINWINLSLASFGIISFFTDKKLLLITLSSLLMVFIDYIIEPIAINLDFWSWEYITVPIHNYFGWFFCAIIAQLLIVFSKVKINKKIAFAVIGSQLSFFIIQYFKHGLI